MSTYERDPTTGNLKLISGVSWSYIKEKIKSILHIDDNTIDDITDVYGAKNFIPPQTSYFATSDGSSWADPELDADGTIYFGDFSDGTYAKCEIDIAVDLPKTSNYIFTSGLTDASDSTAYIEVYKTRNAEAIKVYGEPVVIENVRYIHRIVLVSKDGNARTFKPMLRLASIESNEYVPFAMTNKQLTDLVITKEMLHPVGTVIHSTTCNTMAKVIATYGGTTWIQLSGYMLRGATSGVTANSNAKDGGSDTVTLTGAQSGLKGHGHGFTQPTVNGGATNTGTMSANASHNHNIHVQGTGSSYQYWGSGGWLQNTSSSTWLTDNKNIDHKHSQVAHTHTVSGGKVSDAAASNATSSHSVLPSYKNVYIWERTA